MAQKEIKVGDELIVKSDELLVDARVTDVWPDGQITFILRGGSVKITIPGDSDDIDTVIPGPKLRPVIGKQDKPD